MRLSVLAVAAAVALLVGPSAALRAGAAKLDSQVPVGVPLAGYNYAPRSVKGWPVPRFTKYTTFMTPSEGIMSPIYVKALALEADNGTPFVFVTLDVIGTDGEVADMAYDYAVEKYNVTNLPRENIIFSSAHTHSGPGAMSHDLLWALAPATDLCKSEVQQNFANRIAQVIAEAMSNMQPAELDIGLGNLAGVTHNRRSDEKYSHVDTTLGVVRVQDQKTMRPVGVVWNFAIHGICYDSPNLLLSSEIMGAASDVIEEELGGGVALFINGDAGDVNPIFSAVCGDCKHPKKCVKRDFPGAAKFADAVKQVYDSLSPRADVSIDVASEVVPFGETNLNLTLARAAGCKKGGPLDVCSLCEVLHCDANVHLSSHWIENMPRFTAASFTIGGKKTGLVTVPGEALTDLGLAIRSDMAALGFEQTILAGYTNNHLGYFAPEKEYDDGDYESLLTFWGVRTADRVRSSCRAVAARLP